MGLLNDLDAGIPSRVYDVIITSDINESKLAHRRLLLQDSTAVVNLLEVTKGGDTNIGIKSFRDATFGAKAREIFMPNYKSQLSKSQILNRAYIELDGG
jgi:hypothetical protein